ncbi:MAG: glycosyltransferase family 2 protein [Bacilli bacterium]|nr:glycosyltransferase family 2 protein [Bacilli bacterium]
MPNVSIIVPVYNCERFLNKCLDSIINQTYKDFEVILIDDLSKDNSLNIMLDYESKYDNITVIASKKNEGPGSSRNKGLDIAKGKYIMFIDSDDYIEPNTLEDAVKCALEYNADIVRYDFSRSISNIEYADRKLYPKLKEKTKKVSSRQGDYFLLETAGPCNKLFSRELIGNSRFPVGIYFEDLPFVISNILKAENIVHLNEVLYRYRFNPKSIMGANLFGSTKILDILKSCDILDEYVKGIEFDKKRLDSLKLMNTIYIFNDILFWRNLNFKGKQQLISYLFRILELKYEDIYNNESFLSVMKRDGFFRRRIKFMKRYVLKKKYMISSSLDELLSKASQIINLQK